jgi:alpha-beta hydrolase superfamily lysophospholipase
MLSTARTRLALGLALAGLLWAPTQAVRSQAAKGKADFKRVTIKTGDGAELQGYFYPGGGGKKDATVLLLHHFDPKKGGSSQTDGLPLLAERLQKEGYSVLTFDFRGFGESKTVGKEFWDLRRSPYNQFARRTKIGKNLPESIDHAQFNPAYYPYLANDVAAAKAYLDRRNDAGDLNSSNLVLIGAGEGASVGALWLRSECSRHRDKNPLAPALRPDLVAEPESKDVACAVWLSVQPTLGGRPNPMVRNWLVDAGRAFKVPMAFIYGDKDTRSVNFAESCLKAIKAGAPKGKMEFTGKKPIEDTELSGAALLRAGSVAERFIVKDYLEPALEKRGSKESVRRKVQEQRYFYKIGPRLSLAKPAGDDVPRVGVSLFLGR